MRTVRDHLVEDTREQLLEYLSAAGQQAMEMAALWHAPACGGGLGGMSGSGSRSTTVTVSKNSESVRAATRPAMLAPNTTA